MLKAIEALRYLVKIYINMAENKDNHALKKAVADLVWMARRYANERQTYAPDLFNDSYDVLRAEFGDEIDKASTFNQQNEPVYDISIDHSNVHPYAVYGHDKSDSQTNEAIPRRKFYVKPKLKNE